MIESRVLLGEALAVLRTLDAGSVNACVTSPPYWGLRDYGTGRWEGGDPACEHRSPTMREGRNENRALLAGEPASNSAQLLLAHRTPCGKCGAVKVDEQIGLEETPDAYVDRLVDVFREVRRVLREDGTLWLNLGDSYCAAARGSASPETSSHTNPARALEVSGAPMDKSGGGAGQRLGERSSFRRDRAPRLDVQHKAAGFEIKPKDLVGIPWLVAFALRADGWYLRSEIIWHKPNPMPESVVDRPTKSHEQVFLLSKHGNAPLLWRAADTREWSRDPDFEEEVDGAPRWRGFDYFYDADAIAEASLNAGVTVGYSEDSKNVATRGEPRVATRISRDVTVKATRNRRSVWTVATKPFAGAHFAVMPVDLVEPCILAGVPAGGTVLDPFTGSGTVGVVAMRTGRSFVGVELNPEYAAMARKRIGEETPASLFVVEEAEGKSSATAAAPDLFGSDS